MRLCVTMISSALVASQVCAAVAPGDAVEQLRSDLGGGVQITLDRNSGTIRHLRLREPVQSPAKSTTVVPDVVLHHGHAFGLTDPATELRLVDQHEDRFGWTHTTFEQVHHGVPVSGARLRAHSDAEGRLYGITAGLVPFPQITADDAVVSAGEAETVARAFAEAEHGTANLSTRVEGLAVVRGGLLRSGVGGRDYLAWEVAITRNQVHVEDIYIDSARGTLVERIPRVADLHRVVHHATIPNPIWSEGDARPFSGMGAATDAEVEALIDTSGEVYNLFRNLSGGTYLSWDGAEAEMHHIVAFADDENLTCPNAWWNGGHTSFCDGLGTDDIAAHEWGHAYTESTHGLIYLWQSGALNESYSDVFGEVVDQLNDIGLDAPGAPRTPGVCSAFAGGVTTLTVTAPADLAGDYLVGRGKFNPDPPWTMHGTVELAVDETGAHDGCADLVGFTPGNIALIELGNCFFYGPVARAEAAGAAGAIIINTLTDAILDMPGAGDPLGIPAVLVRRSDGVAFRAAAEAGTLQVSAASAESSYRWLIGEDSALGVIRDMWVPSCVGDPGSVEDDLYWCDTSSDNGGVHSNSGVPNRVFSLLVDGGPASAIGVTKAAHIYWRAMTVYQIPFTDFADHADALQASCSDLVGAPLSDLSTGDLSGDVVTAEDCEVVDLAIETGALRAATPCNFRPLLSAGHPALARPMVLLDENFTNPALAGWQLEDEGVFPEYDPRRWSWVETPPDGSDGAAMFAAADPTVGSCFGDNQSGVVRLTTPAIEIPTGSFAPVLLVDHYVATFDDRRDPYDDGGNLKISVNGGDFELVPTSAFLFNRYPRDLRTAEDGNSNPLAGQPAFTGTNQGSFDGSWGQSQVDLAGLADAGDEIRLRFDFGTDGCRGLDGWYLDRVQVVAAPTAREGSGRAR